MTIPDAEVYEETNLHYIVKQIEQYRDKTVVICGGGDTAVDWALTLEPVAEKVYLVHRRDRFRAHEGSVEALKESRVEILTPFIPYEMISDNNTLDAVVFKKQKAVH